MLRFFLIQIHLTIKVGVTLFNSALFQVLHAQKSLLSHSYTSFILISGKIIERVGFYKCLLNLMDIPTHDALWKNK